MSGSDLMSIPLPQDGSSQDKSKKSAREMLQQALKDHKVSVGKEANSSSKKIENKLAAALGPKIKMAGSNGAEESSHSQSIVDELFKDFIAQKLSHPSKAKEVSMTEEIIPDAGNGKSVDEMSKILDMEINSIQSHSSTDASTSEVKVKSSSEHKSKSSSKRSRSSSGSSKHKRRRSEDDLSDSKRSKQADSEVSHVNAETSNSLKSQTITENKTRELHTVPETPDQLSTFVSKSQAVPPSTSVDSGTTASTFHSVSTPVVTTVVASSSVTTSTTSVLQGKTEVVVASNNDKPTAKPSIMLPSSLAKKLVPPKLWGVKLSTESMSLIQSTDRIDRDGRVWEEGEVHSSHSEEEKEMSDSGLDDDDDPSETGSINSTAEETKKHSSKHKKKRKHKHKKKKKKSSKEKDSKERDKDKKDKDKHKDRDKEKGKEKSKDKDRESKHSEKEKDREKISSKDESENKDRRSSGDDGRRQSIDKKEGKESEKKDEKGKRDKDKHSSKDRSEDKDHEGSRRKGKKKGSRSRSKSPRKHKRSKSKSPRGSESPRRRALSSSGRSHYSEWDARRYSDDTVMYRSRSRSRSRGRSSDKHKQDRDRKSHDRDRERRDRDLRLQIDKTKLRKIAIAKALQNMKSGQGPQVDLTSVKSGGKSVAELTEFCKKISETSKARLGSDDSDSSDEDIQRASDDEDMLIHHPFKVRDATQSNIVMNIRNAKQLPVLTPSEKQAQQAALRLAFPVSSGSHHRANESEWVPVEKTTAQPTPTTSTPATTSQASTTPIPPAPPPEEPKKQDSIFPDQSDTQKIDIGSIISERLQAVRKLQQNPYDVQALSKMHQVEEQASKWATSRHLPGQFVGSTGAHVMSQEEIMGDRKHQAWAKKTQLTQAAPVNGGIGMFLLQKMGWKQGEGLGKNNEGSKEPLMLDIKIDRKGLTTSTENTRQRAQVVSAPRAKDLSNKHPVSALMELCNKRRWGPPVFTVVSESGPDHKKNFLFKVKVNNVEYQPCVPSSNKKLAKAQCAAVCLQEMGLIPRDAPLNI